MLRKVWILFYIEIPVFGIHTHILWNERKYLSVDESADEFHCWNIFFKYYKNVIVWVFVLQHVREFSFLSFSEHNYTRKYLASKIIHMNMRGEWH